MNTIPVKLNDKIVARYDWILLLILASVPVAFYIPALRSEWVSDSDVHSVLEFAAAFTALAAAGIILIHFFATGRRFFLMLSLGFTLQGAEDLIHAVYAFSRFWPAEIQGLQNFIPGTYVTGRLILVTCIFLALRLEVRDSLAKNKTREALVYNVVGFLAGILLTVIIINSPLPRFILPEKIISRPVDFAAALMYLAAFILYGRIFTLGKGRTFFKTSLMGSILFGFFAQLYMVHSQQLYDAQFDLSHVLKITSYIFPVFGIALGTFNMYRREAKSGKELSDAIGKLTNVVEKIKEAVYRLGTSTTEISGSAAELVGSSEESATAVSEAVTTMNEIRQTSSAASEHADYVTESAKKTVEISAEGESAVYETIENMGLIEETTSQILNSIKTLKEKSMRIEQIIMTMDDIAEQSNLLSVNAAIEAAKAGEHGKGFEVIAREIKDLSLQSKDGTSQVSDVLKSIQIAISDAVSATDMGMKSVRTGREKSVNSENAIKALSESISQAEKAVGQISVSLNQQVTGISQMADAMEQIKLSSNKHNRNAIEIEKQVQSINELSIELSELVEKYKI